MNNSSSSRNSSLVSSLVRMTGILFMVSRLFFSLPETQAQEILFPQYDGLVMCGYQGWFRADGDPSNSGWGHYGHQGKLDPEHLTIDLWPAVDEYEKTYATEFRHSDGSPAYVFSSVDPSTTDLHFKWAKEYGIDGFFMQRFYQNTRPGKTVNYTDTILLNAMKASKKYERAFAVMYDLSGLRPGSEDCLSIIDDWKKLVDELDILNKDNAFTYLHHHQRPLVAIWGIGFPDRPYNIRDIKILELIDFLKNDPVYGGCAVMLGVPTYFRDLDSDCVSDPFLHEIIEQADIIMPWMVGRFTMDVYSDMKRYADQVKKDIEWCAQRSVDYAPCVYPGFSWYNLSKKEFGGKHRLNAIPRKKGEFYWAQISNAIEAGATMLYVAMFDEIDESTAIFKCTNTPPVNGTFIDYEGMPEDHYLRLTGLAGKILRNEQEVIDFDKISNSQ